MGSWDLGAYSPNGQGLSGSLTHFLAVLGLRCCVGFSLVVASWGYSSCRVRTSHYGGFSCYRAVSVIAAHRLSCSLACEIFQHQESNLSLLHWQADSYPLYHQGSPV